MQHTTQPIILQSAAPSVAPEVGLLEQAGLGGLIAFLAIKEALAWWRQRGDTQQSLVTTLVADLRANNQELIGKLLELNSQQHRDMAELREGLRGMCDRLDKLL